MDAHHHHWGGKKKLLEKEAAPCPIYSGNAMVFLLEEEAGARLDVCVCGGICLVIFSATQRGAAFVVCQLFCNVFHIQQICETRNVFS